MEVPRRAVPKATNIVPRLGSKSIADVDVIYTYPDILITRKFSGGYQGCGQGKGILTDVLNVGFPNKYLDRMLQTGGQGIFGTLNL